VSSSGGRWHYGVRYVRLEDIVTDADLVLPVRRLSQNGFEAWSEVIARDCEGYFGKEETSLWTPRLASVMSQWACTAKATTCSSLTTTSAAGEPPSTPLGWSTARSVPLVPGGNQHPGTRSGVRPETHWIAPTAHSSAC